MKVYKTEIKPTKHQKEKIHKTIGVCRFLYNRFIHVNSQLYKSLKHLGLHKQLRTFMTGYEFDKYVNNVLSKQEGLEWIKEVSSKARKQAIMNAETAFKKFFKKEARFPRFKKKSNQNVKCYFPKNNKTDWKVERHKINIPTLGFMHLKEKGFIPVNGKVISGMVSRKADRYYVSVLVNEDTKPINTSHQTDGVGVDVGIKEFAVVSDGRKFKNINKSLQVRKLKKRLKRSQRQLSRKYEFKKKVGVNSATSNITKQILKVQKLHCKLNNIRLDYIRKIAHTLVKTKPEYITIEDLNIKGMMKNRHLSRAIGEQCFSKFTEILINKCKQFKVELRKVSRTFPSSKKCNVCGKIKKDLKLSDRIYKCGICKYEIDRDLGAGINLAMAKEYTIVT